MSGSAPEPDVDLPRRALRPAGLTARVRARPSMAFGMAGSSFASPPRRWTAKPTTRWSGRSQPRSTSRDRRSRSSAAPAAGTRRSRCSGMQTQRRSAGVLESRHERRRPVTLLIEHLDELFPVAGPAPRAGTRQGDHGPIADAAVACAGARIVAVGPTAEVRAAVTLGPGTRLVGRPRPIARARLRRCAHARRCSPAIGATSCGGGSRARPTQRLRRTGAAFWRPSARPARRRRRNWRRRRQRGSTRC